MASHLVFQGVWDEANESMTEILGGQPAITYYSFGSAPYDPHNPDVESTEEETQQVHPPVRSESHEENISLRQSL